MTDDLSSTLLSSRKHSDEEWEALMIETLNFLHETGYLKPYQTVFLFYNDYIH